MKRALLTTSLAGLLALVVLAPTAAAHGHATVIEGNARCYIYTSTLDGQVRLFRETSNLGPNVPTGGPSPGLPFWDLVEFAAPPASTLDTDSGLNPNADLEYVGPTALSDWLSACT